jgi:hypothetical protein
VHSKDKNERRRNLPVEMVWETAYGRLDYVLSLELEASLRFSIDEPRRVILAHITEARGAIGDATETVVSYQQMGRSFVLDIRAIENVVGRVDTSGMVQAGEFVIVDRSNAMCRTAFHNAELRDVDDDDDM